MITNILFVDDDEDIISGYRRMLHSMRNQWGLYFASSGLEALEVLGNNPMDVIISDMRMPGMDGADLLAQVKKEFPQILRIVLSGHQDEMRAIRATGVAHQFNAKPTTTEIIKNTIERAFFLRNYVQNEKILKLITGIGELPGLPEIYIKVEEELRKDDVSLSQVARLISNDISITVKIMQIVNSSFFGLRMRITDLLQAVTFLGINTIKAVILHASLFSSKRFSAASRRYCEIIANHSMIVGNIAKSIAIQATPQQEVHEDAFMAGILHDIGKIILLSLPDYEEKVNSESNLKNLSMSSVEWDMYGFTHGEAGAYLIGIWGLPGPIVEATAFHHIPTKLEDNQFTPLTAVHVANGFVNTPIKNFDKIKNIRESGIVLDFSDYIDIFPSIDFNYLKITNSFSKFNDWLEIYFKFLKQIEDSNE